MKHNALGCNSVNCIPTAARPQQRHKQYQGGAGGAPAKNSHVFSPQFNKSVSKLLYHSLWKMTSKKSSGMLDPRVYYILLLEMANSLCYNTIECL